MQDTTRRSLQNQLRNLRTAKMLETNRNLLFTTQSSYSTHWLIQHIYDLFKVSQVCEIHIFKFWQSLSNYLFIYWIELSRRQLPSTLQ